MDFDLVPAAVASGICLAVAIYFYLPHVFPRKQTLKFPVVLVEDGGMDNRAAVEYGYSKYPDQPFVLQSKKRTMVLLPPKYFDEIRSIPESKWSGRLSARNLFQSRYTRIGDNSHEVVHTVKTDLTRHIGKTLDALQDEMEFAAEQAIGACEDWTPVAPYPALLRIVSLISGRVLVGLPFSRTEQWIQISINFTMLCFGAAQKYATYSSWLRPFVVPFLDVTRNIHKQRKVATALLAPVITKYKNSIKSDEEPANMIQWALASARDDSMTAEEQADIQLTLSMAAIHTTSTTVLYCLYDLCAHPEYIEPLRKELKTVLAETDGRLVKRNMAKLRKLDSFIKESQRLSPPGLVAMQRIVVSDITLSDGSLLPSGTAVGVPNWGVTRDGQLWANPETFDGFRFAKLRDEAGAEHRHQFATAGPDSLSFGYGPQACPGRFFASNEIKVLLAHLLLNYDFKLEGDRPQNIIHELTVMPNRGVNVLFKKRAQAEQ
ncbi:hypothetical protein FQN49_003401 [Arthroderma sp. PD_2]|nr:hypothetical protein FQN49_003401 [Arthroderma sp. PD_2]